MSWAMVALFGAHLLAFGALWVKRGGVKYARLTVLFALLVTHYGLRAVGADFPLGSVALSSVLRGVALVLAAWSLGDFVVRRMAQRT
jgi:hypothetical protein